MINAEPDRGAHTNVGTLFAITLAATFSGILVVALAGCPGLRPVTPDPNGKQPPVDFRQGLAFAQRANAAYRSPAEIRERYAGRRVVVRDLHASRMRYFILFDDDAKRQDIAIRGTDNLANVRTDVEFEPKADPKTGLHLHRGFAKTAREVHADIVSRLRPGWATTLTGHSLGGAVAAILAADLETDGFEVRRIITFGQPKVTNRDGAKRAASLPMLRFVNTGDPVPEVPPLVPLTTSDWVYTHFGPEVVLSADGTYRFERSHRAMQSSVLSFWQNLGAQRVDAHKMTAYIAAIGKCLQRQSNRGPRAD